MTTNLDRAKCFADAVERFMRTPEESQCVVFYDVVTSDTGKPIATRECSVLYIADGRSVAEWEAQRQAHLKQELDKRWILDAL